MMGVVNMTKREFNKHMASLWSKHMLNKSEVGKRYTRLLEAYNRAFEEIQLKEDMHFYDERKKLILELCEYDQQLITEGTSKIPEHLRFVPYERYEQFKLFI